MFKAVCLLTGLFLPLFTIVPLVKAQETETQVAAGICGLYNHSGYLVVDETGNLVDMVEYCQQQQIHQRSQVESQQSAVESTAASSFWRTFETTANAEARQMAATLGREEIMDYGTTICPFLQQGGTLHELRRIQTDGNLPSNFETAVTVAAIHTYCPAYRSELGR
jgi:hypothetical protein